MSLSYAVINEVCLYGVFGVLGWLAACVFHKIKDDESDKE